VIEEIKKMMLRSAEEVSKERVEQRITCHRNGEKEEEYAEAAAT
jgi:hypothetical protein